MGPRQLEPDRRHPQGTPTLHLADPVTKASHSSCYQVHSRGRLQHVSLRVRQLHLRALWHHSRRRSRQVGLWRLPPPRLGRETMKEPKRRRKEGVELNDLKEEE